MREINNNSSNVEIAKMQKPELKTSSSENVDAKVSEEAENLNVTDFSNPTEVLGRSQVGKADNLKADVAFGFAHPEAIESADRFFDMAYAQLQEKGDPAAYEKASSMASLYAKELI